MSSARSSNRTHDRNTFFKYVTADVAQVILSKRTLRWSSPFLFNDPFDVPRTFTPGFSEAELFRDISEEVARLIEAGETPPHAAGSLLEPVFQLAASASTRDRTSIAEYLRAGLRDGSLKSDASFAEIKAFWEDLIPRFRILCLSETKDSPPMWTHYSDRHRGAVIELLCHDALDSAWLVARPVQYSDTPPQLATREAWVKRFSGQGTLSYEHLFKEYEYAKSIAWSYEREWRVVTLVLQREARLYSDGRFHPQEMCSVYLGEKMPDRTAEAILSLLRGDLSHVRAFRTVSDVATGRLRFDPIT